LCFFNESPTWLAACVTSMHRFCDHVICLDGGYRLYPNALPSSGAPSHDAIVKAAEAVGLGLTLHIPAAVFENNEVEKRTLAFRLGEALAEPEVDWYFILDADEVVVHHGPNVLEDLAQTPLDVASLSMIERVDWHRDEHVEAVGRAGFAASRSLAHSRRFYRAIPGLRAVGNHYTFVADRDGRTMTLRGLEQLPHEQWVDLDVEIEHRHQMRDMERAHAKEMYYRLRDATLAETEPDEILAEIAAGAG
jgi:hypothetical protein